MTTGAGDRPGSSASDAHCSTLNIADHTLAQLPRQAANSGTRFSLKALTPSCASGVSPKSFRLEYAIWPTDANCSVSVLNDCFKIFKAVGESIKISLAHARTSDLSSSAGTTLLTSPHFSACSAEYRRHKNQISRARFSPTTRAR